MGLDVSFQAIPVDSRLLELACADLKNGDDLGSLAYWFRQPDGPDAGQEGEGDRCAGPLWDECCRLCAVRPDIRSLNCLLARWWDRLHYVLSATRRGEASTAADRAVDRAFGQGDLIAEHISGGQGIPVRYLTPEAVAQIAAVVGPMDSDDLARHYDPIRMEAAAVYKFWADRADAAGWAHLVQCFTEFRDLFVAAAEKGDGMVVDMD